MLKALSLIFVSALVGSTAEAQDYISRLLRMYGESRPPIQQEMTGWFSGRCYRVETPAMPFGAILVGRVVRIEHGDPNNGPAFPPRVEERHQYNIFGRGYQGTQAPADHFDELDWEKIAFVEDLLDRGVIHTSTSRAGSLQAVAPEANLVIQTRLYPTREGVEPRENPGYHVAKLTALRNYPPFRAGDLFGMCYFFKQVH